MRVKLDTTRESSNNVSVYLRWVRAALLESHSIREGKVRRFVACFIFISSSFSPLTARGATFQVTTTYRALMVENRMLYWL